MMELGIKFQWQNHQIENGLREGVDFIFVTKAVFDFFIENYRSVEPEPQLNYKRYGVLQDDGEVVCELKLRKINFFALPNKTQFKMKNALFCFVPKSDTVLDLEKKLLRMINYYMMTVRKEKSIMVMKCRLWKVSEYKIDDLKALDQKFINFTHAKTEALPISVTEAQKRLRVDDLNFVDDDIFIVETPKNGNFVFSNTDDADEESKESIAD